MPDQGLIGKTIEHYQIKRLLGQGGMAAVYEATDQKLERPVALKVMHPHLASQESFQRRFLQEARAAASLDHPNIIRVLAFNKTEGMLFLVMELVTGGNLRKYVKRLHEFGRFVDYPEAVELMRQLATALDYAHTRGMIHRDIKPDNVVLKPKPKTEGGPLDYVPILTDFGLAKLTVSGEDAITDQQPIGTYPYMSPEQCLADEVDTRSDIYSLGVMLYELAIGRLPYNPKSIAEAARMHGREILPLPSNFRQDFPVALEQVIVKSLNKNRADRYQTAGEMAYALEELQQQSMPSQPQAKVAWPGVPTSEEAYATEQSTEPIPVLLAPVMPYFEPPPFEGDQTAFDRLVFYGEQYPTVTALLDKNTMTIGRGNDQDVSLAGQRISRQHARVERKPNGKYYLIDVGSTNGTWVNDRRLEVNKPVIFDATSVVRLGDYWMLFEHRPEAPAEVESPVGENMAFVAGEVAVVQDAVVDTGEVIGDIDTEQMAAPLPAEIPAYTPPPLTVDQMGYARLVFYSETFPIITVKLDKDRISIGRDENRDITLQGRWVSRRHADIERRPGGNYYIIDRGSTNGVWIENERLDPGIPTILDPNKVIRLGNYWLKFERERDIHLPVSAALPSISDTLEIPIDPKATVEMVAPLPEEMPQYSPPPLTVDQQANDRLIFFSEDHPLQFVRLDRETLNIGRAEDQDIVLLGKRVSRQHVRLECKPDGHIYMTDLGSTNGTWVGDTLLVANTQVLWEPDEIVRIGNYWLKFERGTRAFDPFAGAGVGLRDTRGLVGSTIKNYRIDRFLGQGSVASVYKATELPLDRPVALKIMHPNLAAQPALRQRFLREARVSSRLDHPNVVRVLSYDDVDKELFMVMELIPGGNLRNYLNRLHDEGKRMEIAEAIDMATQMADGLHYAHQQGMIHRDIRPESIMLKSTVVIGPIERHQPVLTDFGLARLSDTGEIYITDKPENAFPYMSPEQCLGERVDIRSDIYELAVVLYEMLTGRPPFQPRSIAEAVRMHARESLVSPSERRPDVPEALEKVLFKALEKDPNNRYQSGAEMSRALQRVAAAFTEGISEGQLLGIPEVMATVIMEQVLPDQMPLATRQPLSEDQVGLDRLVLYSEAYPTTIVPLNKNVLTLGRADDQDIILNSPKISHRHVRIERGFDNSYRIVDLGSKNGTWLSNWRLIPNVSEIWEPSNTVRIGDYWLRIETANSQIPVMTPVDREQVEEDDEYITDAGDGQAGLSGERPPVPGQDKIGLTLETTHLQVPAGGSVALSVEVVNLSDLVDHFKVELHGLPAEWVSQPTAPLYLLPQNRDTTSITIHPPLASSSSAGQHAFEVRVSTRAQGIYSVATQSTLTIEPYHSYVTDLQPQRIKGHGRTELEIRNTGNTPGIYTIEPRDREDAVRFSLDGRQYMLLPDHVERIRIHAAPRKRHLFGASQQLPFEVMVTPVPYDVAGGPQTQVGELVARPVFPAWMIGLLLLLLVACAAATLLAASYFARVGQQHQTATAVAVATGTTVRITAIAGEDTDGDGLTNAREVELGTDPGLADTDEDGLKDGEEVRVWQTNPLNRDTDGDMVTDGEEVTVLGCNPLEPDSDGDGLRDNEDPACTTQSTPTPTPLPIVDPESDLCYGSPSPSRISVGMKAMVTWGGVSNRLRDNPGKQVGSIIGYMAPGAEFNVIGGPSCDMDDGIRWWQVDFNGQQGWTAEGEGSEYYLAPPGEGGDGSGAASVMAGSVSVDNIGEVAASLDGASMGVQLDFNTDLNGWSNLMALTDPLVVGWVKIQASWRFLEPDFSGQFDLGYQYFQAHVETARKQGYRVLISIAKAPDWARTADRSEDGPPDDPQQLAQFLDILLQRVGPNIDAIEIWNEPNLQREWSGALPFNGGGYMQLFGPAYQKIRAYSPDIIIVTAGLAPTGTSDQSVDDRKFLQQMYDAGLTNYSDVMIGVHPYSWANEPDARCCRTDSSQGWDDAPHFFFLDTIDSYRSVMQAAGHGDAQLWVTEFGWATWENYQSEPPEQWMTYNTAEEQALFTVRAFQIGQQRDDIGPMFLWNLNYASNGNINNGVEMAAYSLVYPDSTGTLQKRPLYSILSSRAQS